VALVTGSTSGIGRACARRFAAEGAGVVINGFPPERGAQVVEEIRGEGGTAAYCQADVRRAEELRSLVQFVVDTYGRLDILMAVDYGPHGIRVLEEKRRP
jgi:NAD(P)-dependent dehydrogenase (short-subunit alcohol dehydrogenase family)